MADVFISYSRADQDRVQELADRLHAAGADLWIDQAGIGAATRWSQEIVEAIQGCKVFLLVASERSFASPNVAKEISLASEEGKVILPVYLEPADVPASVRYQLAGIQHVELFGEGAENAHRSILVGLAEADIAVELPEGTARPAPRLHHRPPSRRKEKTSLGRAAGLAAGGVVIAVAAFFAKDALADSGEPAILIGVPAGQHNTLGTGTVELIEIDAECAHPDSTWESDEAHRACELPIASVPTETEHAAVLVGRDVDAGEDYLDEWIAADGLAGESESFLAEVRAAWRQILGPPTTLERPLRSGRKLEARFRTARGTLVARKGFELQDVAYESVQAVLLD